MTVAQAAEQLLEVVQNLRERAEEPGEEWLLPCTYIIIALELFL